MAKPYLSQGAIAPRKPSSGGVSAPPRAAKGPATGLANNNKPVGGVPKGGAQPIGTPSLPAGGGASASPYAPLPWDAQYETSVGNANTKYNNALISLGLRKTAAQQEYGLDAGFNDYKSNPYSRASLLEQTYQRANRASGTSLAAGGQLYSGASQNAETYNREHNAQERDSLERLYRAALQQNSDEVLAAGDLRNSEIGDAGWRRVEAASNADLEPETAPEAPKPMPSYATTPSGVKYGVANNKAVAQPKKTTPKPKGGTQTLGGKKGKK